MQSGSKSSTSVRLAAPVLAIYSLLVSPLLAEEPFSVKLIDVSGKPVAGADVGIMAGAGDRVREFADKDGTEWLYNKHLRSDAEGIVSFVDGNELLSRLCLVARHEGRRIAAVASVDPNALPSGEPIPLTLVDEIKVDGRATSKQLDALGQPLKAVVVYVRHAGKIVLECVFNEPTFRLFLPPGDYEISSYGVDADQATKAITVTARSAEQNFEIDLPAAKIAQLTGHQAPEIVDVAAWKNGGPLALADLRGKCVLLDFWGYWCGPCVQEMPKLFELHEKYADRGLVIIGIHVDLSTSSTDRVDSATKLDDRLKAIRNDIWDGRDLPFPVALVTSGEQKDLDGVASRQLGRTVTKYGISAFPTSVLIDRRGDVVGKFYPNAEGMAQLEKLLADQ